MNSFRPYVSVVKNFKQQILEVVIINPIHTYFSRKNENYNFPEKSTAYLLSLALGGALGHDFADIPVKYLGQVRSMTL